MRSRAPDRFRLRSRIPTLLKSGSANARSPARAPKFPAALARSSWCASTQMPSQAISRAYAAHDGSAAQVIGEVEGEADLSRLMQDIPEIEDLLEAEDDAP